MGKTGTGKSTLINAVLEEDLAPTGKGQPVTRENEVYSKKMLLPVGANDNGRYGSVACRLDMYDTVGLEIDHAITDRTLNEIKTHIEKTKTRTNPLDIHVVWFCVNERCNKFEDYELELIRKLSIDYEIPFILVLTQCFSGREGELEKQIKNAVPEVPIRCILAKDYRVRGGVIPAYGIQDLLRTSVVDYQAMKIEILEKKLEILEKKSDVSHEDRKARIRYMEEMGNRIISDYASSAEKIGFFPGVCIPVVHGMCIKMIGDLNDLAGIKPGEHSANEIFEDVIFGLITAPFMCIPLLSAVAVKAYMEQIGEDYMKALFRVIDLSSDYELKDNALVKERLKKELSKIKK